MHIKMHVRTFKFAKIFRLLHPRAPIQQEREREWERAGVERRRGEGKEKVEGMTERKGEEGRHGEFGWGDLRHCS